MGAHDRKTLEKIVNNCAPSQTWAPRPAGFRVLLPAENLVFNHRIEVDVMWTDGDPVPILLIEGLGIV